MFCISEKERVLVVAPHPDDETIGCGGLLALYPEQCDVLLLTDGRKGKSIQRKHCSDEEIIEIRRRELRTALDTAGVKNLICLDIPDSTLMRARKQVMKFETT